MNIIKINWFDYNNADTIELAAKEYGLKIISKKPTGTANKIEVELSGEFDNVATFLEDLEDGEILPMCSK